MPSPLEKKQSEVTLDRLAGSAHGSQLGSVFAGIALVCARRGEEEGVQTRADGRHHPLGVVRARRSLVSSGSPCYYEYETLSPFGVSVSENQKPKVPKEPSLARGHGRGEGQLQRGVVVVVYMSARMPLARSEHQN